MPNNTCYRKCVGITVFNSIGSIWIGKRSDINSGKLWQMPQGGIDLEEKPFEAASRELYEETGIKKVKYIKESSSWLKYEFPKESILKKKFKGQKLKWYLFYFKGTDKEINLNIYKNPEFKSWKWETIDKTIENVIYFKKEVYKSVFKEFTPFINQTIM
jgi:putative (di)nucleoside polyphosphate hydrolase